MRRHYNNQLSQRQLRVGEMIKQSLGQIFIRGEAKVPTLETNNITVTEVRMSPDLKNATAYVIPLGGKDSDKTVDILTDFSHIVRKALAFFKSGLILTSVTVILFVSKVGTLASPFKNIKLKDCLIISPTLNCLCVTGLPNFPIILISLLFLNCMPR